MGVDEGLVGAVDVAEGLVEEEEVDVVGFEAGEGGVDGLGGFLVAVVAEPDFGGEEDLVAGDGAFGDGVADGFFVEVALGGVDGAVAYFEGVEYAAFTFCGVGDLEDAESEHGHLDAVV